MDADFSKSSSISSEDGQKQQVYGLLPKSHDFTPRISSSFSSNSTDMRIRNRYRLGSRGTITSLQVLLENSCACHAAAIYGLQSVILV